MVSLRTTLFSCLDNARVRQKNAQAAYLASNITLKEYIETPLQFPTSEQVFGSKLFAKKYFEWYYHKLLEQTQALKNNPAREADPSDVPDSNAREQLRPNAAPLEKGRSKQYGAGEDGSPTYITDYIDEQVSGSENIEHWDENEWIAVQVNEKIETALQSQSWGTVPGNLREMILAAMRPQVDYRRILNAFRQSVLSSRRVLTRMKPSRRYDFQYLGSRHDFSTKLLFALDVSGSVSTQELQKGLSVLNRFFKYGIERIDVIQFDTEIKTQPMILKKAQHHIEITGRGGTDFSPVMDFIDQNRIYDGLIVFTDGYAPRPHPPTNFYTKILWLFNNEDNYRAGARHVKGIGKSAFLK